MAAPASPAAQDKARIPLGSRLRRYGLNLLRLPAVRRHLRPRFGPDLRAFSLHRVAVFPGLGLAYNRVKKNANTSLTILLRDLDGGGLAQRDIAKWEALTPLDLPRGERALLDRLAWVVVVRDPFSRTLSAFLDKFREEKYCRKHGDFPLTPEGFAAFLRYLDAGGLARDGHWDLQTKLIVGPLDRFDAVLRFETLGADLSAALARLGTPFDPERLQRAYPSDERKQTGASGRLAEFYTPEAEAVVARLYAKDFAALGYAPVLTR